MTKVSSSPPLALRSETGGWSTSHHWPICQVLWASDFVFNILRVRNFRVACSDQLTNGSLSMTHFIQFWASYCRCQHAADSIVGLQPSAKSYLIAWNWASRIVAVPFWRSLIRQNKSPEQNCSLLNSTHLAILHSGRSNGLAINANDHSAE